MATNPSIAMSYRPNVALERRDPLADAANVQSLQANQAKMEDLREFKEFTTRLAAAGKNPDPLVLAREMRASGRPELVMKALELETNIKALGLEEQAYKALIGGAAPAGPSMPQAAPMAAPGSFAADVATRRVNALAPAPAAPINALAPAPAMEPQTQEINRLMGIATQFPNTKAGAQAMKNAELLQKMQPSTPAEVQTMLALGIPLTQAGYQQYRDAQRQDRMLSPQELQQKLQIAGAGANRTNVNVSTEKKYGERFGGLIADQDAAKFSAAENAPNAAATADRVLDLIGTGKVITGTGANVRLQLAKALNLAGGTDSEKIRNTEVLVSSLAETTLGAIKSSNLGAGQGFTNADRDFLEKAKAGQLSYDAKSLTELARLSRLAAEKSAASWNTRVKQIPASALEGTGISTNPVVVPPRKTSSVMNIPQEAIDMLKSGAGTREQFDGTFGPGSAARILKEK
jgi:hypothetical protein